MYFPDALQGFDVSKVIKDDITYCQVSLRHYVKVHQVKTFFFFYLNFLCLFDFFFLN